MKLDSLIDRKCAKKLKIIQLSYFKVSRRSQISWQQKQNKNSEKIVKLA